MRARLADLVAKLGATVDRRAPLYRPPTGTAEPAGIQHRREPAELSEVLAVLRTEHPLESDLHEKVDRLGGLGEVFGLDDLDLLLLVAAVAPHLDANIALLYALLQGADRPTGASVGLTLEVAGIPTLSATAFDRLGETAPMRRLGLLGLRSGGPWLSREILVPERVLAHLAGSDEVEPELRAALTTVAPRSFADTAVLVRSFNAGIPLVWIHTPRGTAGLALAAGALQSLGIGELAVDLRRVADPAGLAPVLGAAAREAAIRGCGLVVAGAELLAGPGRNTLFSQLASARIPVALVGSRGWDPSWLPWSPVTVQAPVLNQQERVEIWRSATGLTTDVDQLGTLRMTPEAITQAAHLAGNLALARGTEITAQGLAQAARDVAGADTATRGATPRFSDLVLPDHADATLRRLVGWAGIRDQVLTDNPQFGSDPSSRGIAALFSGSPGTGKTLAANVVAGELGLDLFQVNLSEIIDKYIGETEKNLERIFHQAESLNVVLFFDEADALFGSRSDVKDAHDRYANQEVAYLLQRIESFDGITILATNLRGNLDPAFVRRLRFIVHFPDPDLTTRRRIWELYLGRVASRDEQDPVDLDLLAGALEVAGGDIRNIMLSATFDAAAADVPLGMRHLLAATEREFHKLGRRLPTGGFSP